jgi:cytochrome c
MRSASLLRCFGKPITISQPKSAASLRGLRATFRSIEMKKKLALCLAMAGFAIFTTLYPAERFAGSQSAVMNQTASKNSPPECWKPAAAIPLYGKTCGKVQDLQLSCYVPEDILEGLKPQDFNIRQRAADIFSWQEFIALNWPALEGRRGLPDWNKKIGDAGARVWETWKEEYEVYLKDGAEPPDWNAPQRLPAGCDTQGVNRHFFRTQKINDVFDSALQAAAATGTLPATLTDQKRHLVRYEIRLNKVIFDYIYKNRLYNGNVQNRATDIEFPDGSMLIKAAWREVSPEEEPFYHTVTACVCEKDQNGQPVKCEKKRMGLVGFHIAQKTYSAPQWIWSTFEQINNVPGPQASGHPAFYNPVCRSCKPNHQTRPGTPNQIVRSAAIPARNPDCSQPTQALDNVRQLNGDVQRALAKNHSVFRYYELINTQWPLPPRNSSPATVFKAQPAALANSTMESFVQPTSSCMGCHAMARTVNPNQFVSAHFSFTLNNAQPAQFNTKVIPPPTKPVSKWDNDNWQQITRGYKLATDTYEMLPAYVPYAKLHCGSCHLNGGANQDAAWWVDLSYKYKSPAALQARINQCFTNSLNGKPLCTPASGGQSGNCDSNQNMNAFTTYMAWLDEQWAETPHTQTPHGFPPISKATGNPVNGQKIFVQKCAVCHRLDGQGRYEYNTYYRPALWGPHSFNQSAGMFAQPQDLAQFVRWNMPLGSGGELTDAEAWDIEAYIHTKWRPGKVGKVMLNR